MEDFSPTTTSSTVSENSTSAPVLKFILIGILTVIVVAILAWNVQTMLANSNQSKNNLAATSPSPTLAPKAGTQTMKPESLTVTTPTNVKTLTTSSTFSLTGEAFGADVVVVNRNFDSNLNNDLVLLTGAKDEEASGKFGASNLTLLPGLNKFSLTSFGVSGKLKEKRIEILSLPNQKIDVEDTSYLSGKFKKVNSTAFGLAASAAAKPSSASATVANEEIKVDKSTKYLSVVKGRSATTLNSFRDSDEVVAIFEGKLKVARYLVLIPKTNAPTKIAIQGNIASLEENESGTQLILNDNKNTRITVNSKTAMRTVENGALKEIKYSDLKNDAVVTVLGKEEKASLTASHLYVYP